MSPIPNSYDIKKPVSGGSMSGEGFEPLPEDVYQVKISDIKLLENEPGYNGAAPEDKLDVEFTIVEKGKYQGRKVWKKIRPMMSAGFNGGQASWLYKLFCAVNQITLTDGEAKSVSSDDVNSMVGKEVRVTVKRKQSAKGKTYNNVVDFLPVKDTAGINTQAVVDGDEIPF